MTESTPAVKPAAVVLDVDGTLVDSNYLHVVAWWEAFVARGHEVSGYDIHRALGLGAEDLVHALLGHDDEQVVSGHAERWAPLRNRVQPYRGARELQQACADRGLLVVWATSGTAEDVAASTEALGGGRGVHAVVNSADVSRGKPAPDIVCAALEAAGVAAARSVMVGDSTYDVRAATAAGVPCIGLLAGGISERELRQAGAAAVYGGCADLLAGLEQSPVGALLGG